MATHMLKQPALLRIPTIHLQRLVSGITRSTKLAIGPGQSWGQGAVSVPFETGWEFCCKRQTSEQEEEGYEAIPGGSVCGVMPRHFLARLPQYWHIRQQCKKNDTCFI